MSSITSIFNTVEFIEKHLKNDITIADMAVAASFSLYHFSRTFNKIIHHTPYDYLMRRRLSEAARELLATDKKIIEIALDYQFNSPETFSRAFKRMFGLQPLQWRKQRTIDPRFLMPRLTLRHIQHINKGDYLKPMPAEKNSIHAAGLMTVVKDDKTIIDQLWKILAKELQAIEDDTLIERYYGLKWYPENWVENGYYYMAAVETKSPDNISPALVLKSIPAAWYAKFVHKGLLIDLNLTLDYIYLTWLPKSGKRLSHPLELEDYGPSFRFSNTEELETAIYVPIE